MTEKNNTTLLFMGGIIALIIAIALVTPLASEGNKVTTKTTVASELIDIASARNATGYVDNTVVFTLANAPTSWKQQDCPVTVSSATNTSGFALTSGTDYQLTASTGKITFKNTKPLNATGSPTQNNTYWTYTYCPDIYLTQDWARSSVNLTMGMFALACFLASVAMFYGVAKNTGIIGK